MKQKRWFSDLSYRIHLNRKIKDRLLHPLIIILDRLHIRPDYINLFSIILMILFVIFIKYNLVMSSLCLLLAILSDGLDGSLSRYQKISSDKGKFQDMLSDQTCFFLYLIGISLAGLINPIINMIVLYLIFISKIFRIIINSQKYKSNWLFKPVAGTILAWIISLIFLDYFIYVIFKINIFNITFMILIPILFIDALIFLRLILKINTKNYSKNNEI